MSKQEINNLIEDVKKDDTLLQYALSGRHNVMYATKELVQLASFYSKTVPFILEAMKNNYPQLGLNPLYLKFCWFSTDFITGDAFKNFLATLPGRADRYHVIYGGGIDYWEKNPTHKMGIYLEKNPLSGKFKVFIYDPAGVFYWIGRILYQCTQSPEIERIYVWNMTIQKSAYGCDTFAISGICDIASIPHFFELLEGGMQYPDQQPQATAGTATVYSFLNKLIVENKPVTIGKLTMNSRSFYQCMTGQNLVTQYLKYTPKKLLESWGKIKQKTQFVNSQNILPPLNILFRNTQLIHGNTELKQISKRLREAKVSLFFSTPSHIKLEDHIQNHIIEHKGKIYSSALISSAQLLTQETLKRLATISNSHFQKLNSVDKRFKRNNNIALLALLLVIFTAITGVIVKLLSKTNDYNPRMRLGI